MKMNELILPVLILTMSGTFFQLRAQQQASPTCTNALNILSDTNSHKSFEERKARAESGDVIAQLSIGYDYYLGRYVPQNYGEAAKWLTKAADHDFEKVLEQMPNLKKDQDFVRYTFDMLGDCCEKVTPKDFAAAARWYRKAGELGMAKAQRSLGFLYLYGEGVPTNHVEAVMWFRKAAEQGDKFGQGMLGNSYRFGVGVRRDYVEAYKWLNLASEQIDFAESLSQLEQLMTTEQIAEAQRLSRSFKPHKEKSSSGSSAPEISSSSGTGFFITADGFLISNNHVVEGASKVRVVTSAGIISAKVVRVDAANDLALLKAEGKFSPLPLAASRGVKSGGTVVTVGFPNIGLQGFAPKLAKGEIASLSGAGDDARYFQISVPVQPGNSGGALVDERGNVVGVVSAKLSAKAALAASGSLPENVNYAVKSSFLLSFLESVPEVSAKLREPETKERKFEDVVKSAQDAAVLVLVY